jgi:hypothetical protein
MNRNYNDQFWEHWEKKTGGSANAVSIWESKEGWAEEVRQDAIQEYQTRIEQDAISKMDTRIASESGFMSATSNMARQHDTSAGNMRTVDRGDHASYSAGLKEKAGLDAGQIAQQKSDLAGGIQQGATQVQERLDQHQSTLDTKDKTMNKEFKESNEENIISKGVTSFGNPWKFDKNNTNKDN